LQGACKQVQNMHDGKQEARAILERMNTTEDVEALERAVAELDVLESIYNQGEEGREAFQVMSKDALETARAILQGGETNTSSIPRLDMVLRVPLEHDITAVLRCGMPPGYPASQSALVSVEIPSVTRSAQDELTKKVAQNAEQLIGEEAVLTLAQTLQDMGADALAFHKDNKEATTAAEPTTAGLSFSRQWLFMDHIKAESRRAQMIKEASYLDIGGLIKPGYPGVCVIEGDSQKVDQFVLWMKHIWIGRVAVRGQVVTDVNVRQLPSQLTDLGVGKSLPNMGVLGSACREAGLEHEFLEYIMQIKPS